MAYLNNKHTELGEDSSEIGRLLYAALNQKGQVKVKLSQIEVAALMGLERNHNFEIAPRKPCLGYFLMDLFTKEASRLGECLTGNWTSEGNIFLLNFSPAPAAVGQPS